MAAVTSSIMLMSQIKNAWNPYVKVIVLWRFHFFCLNRFEAGAILKRLSFSVLLMIDCYFNGLFWSNALNMHIFMISGSKSIRINIFYILVTSGFNGFFIRHFVIQRWWRRMLYYNPKPRNEDYYWNHKFQYNRIKTVAATVLPLFRKRWRPWRHQLC